MNPIKDLTPFSCIWCYSYPKIAAKNLALQAHFQHILQFKDNFEDSHFEDQPAQDQIKEPPQPQPIQPQQLQPAKRGRPPKPVEEDPEYKPRVTPVLNPNYIARHTKARWPDELPHEPFGVLDSISAVGTSHSRTSSPASQKSLVEYRKPRSKNHQIIFQRLREYATDSEFHFVHIPVPLGIQIQIADQAL